MKNLIIILFALYCSLYSQDLEDKVIAVVGDSKIYESEFLKRFELTPQLGRHSEAGMERAKTDFLYTLIAEKLWSEEMSRGWIDTSYSINSAINFIEAMFVRDALYKIIVSDKIQITQPMLNAGLSRAVQNRFLNFIFSEQEEEIRKLHHLLAQGIPFDSLLSARPELAEQGKPVEIEYGQMDEQIEDSVYTLNINEFTSPLLTPDGWYIFRFVGSGSNKSVKNLAGEDLVAYVKKIISKRQAKRLQSAFFQEFLGDKRVDVDSKLFGSLARKLVKLYKDKQRSRTPESTTLEYLTPEDVHKIENEFGADSLDLPFIKLDENPVSLKTFVRKIVFDGFGINIFSQSYILNYLNSIIKKNIEFELFAREGFKRGLNNLPEVQSEVNMWRTNYHFQAGKNALMQSVSPSDSAFSEFVQKVAEKRRKSVLINVAKITVSDAASAQKILADLSEGADFTNLARNYSIDSYSGKTNFESGFHPIEDFGEIGRLAEEMEPGEVFGPIMNGTNFVIFKLLGKKSETENLTSAEGKQKLMSKYLRRKFSRRTAELAQKYKVNIFEENLRNVETTTVNTFAVRVLGFGGKISAVPLTAPFTDWVQIWKRLKGEAL